MKNKKLIRLTEADLHRIVKESVNRVISESLYEEELDESGGFMDGLKSGYNRGALNNWNNGEATNDLSVQGQGYRKGDKELTKGKAIRNRIGMALGSMAGGRLPKNTFKGMNWDKR